MALSNLPELMLSAVEDTMKAIIADSKSPLSSPDSNQTIPLHHMLAYHLGWEGEGAGSKAQGKRVRPLLLLLTNASAGGVWEAALPAAAAVELLHNFSLIHDDIEDNSDLRRGRWTIWKKWGIPQAINTGDALFSLANIAILNLKKSISADRVISALEIYHKTCLHLTQGQYLDIDFELRDNVSVEEYWTMINGKTAALISACTTIGAITAGSSPENINAYQEYGLKLGLAFQVQDDLLGIWGDSAATGKSNKSDLVEGKKTIPILFGLSQNGSFAEKWSKGPIQPDSVKEIANQLEQEGARTYTEGLANRLTQEAISALERATPRADAGNHLRDLTQQLLNRTY